jgi:predicted Zn finger-like uncharacterized protein
MPKLVCPQCGTAYDISPAALGAMGRQVRCVRCQTIWFVELSEPEDRESEEGMLDGSVFGADEARPAPDEPATAEDRAVFAAGGASAMETDDAVSHEAPTFGEQSPTAEPDPAATATDADLPVVTAPVIDIESSAEREQAAAPPPPRRRPPRQRRAHWLTAAIILLALINVAVLAERTTIARTLPQTASFFDAIGLPVNLRNLAFRDLKTSRELHDGIDILVIEGKIVSTGSATADVPRLRFAIDAANGREIYAWTSRPKRSKLAPGEALPFRTRLASPPEQGRTVKIRFFTRLDLATGLR